MVVERGVGQPHEREHVEADRAFLVDDVEIGERAERPHARVVDEKVDRVGRRRAGALRPRPDLLRRGGRRRAASRRTPWAVTELGGDRLEPGAVAGDEHDFVATSGERVDERAPDTGGRPGDERGGHAERLQRAGDGVDVGGDRVTDLHLADRPLGILQPVSGDGAHHDVVGNDAGPSAAPWNSPAIDAADAGSTKQPSSEARNR